MTITIHPLEQVLLDGVPIRFGMKRAEVEAALGAGQAIGARHYYQNSELAIDYDRDDRVEFVEFLAGAEGALRPVLYGVSAFDTDADVLADLLLEHSGGEAIDEERGYSLQFPAIGIGVYRETTPADVQQMIGEMQANGIPTEDNEDVAAELRRASRWATLGAGVAGYYRR